ncbi:hypothetical protein [Melghirimyces algeriensis]|uniref:Uncharacterized protein n=1 Tax=Melghirimyces algeriensis TaxID=910412 RepID=A0A521D7A2_9BACL|nr:hypothetical protein [Melghirimyces algeriensis]SMO67564.1 hypothetical protein SAMN06264849_105174 [Melghirimyces algeriensis]
MDSVQLSFLFPDQTADKDSSNRLADNLLSPFVRWLEPEGVKRTSSTFLLEERDAETESLLHHVVMNLRIQ